MITSKGLRSSNFTQSLIENEEEMVKKLSSPLEDSFKDPFTRVNKFRNPNIQSNVGAKLAIKNPRYSHQETGPQHFSSAAPSHFPQIDEEEAAMGRAQTKKMITTLDNSLLDIVN
jgi:hypothetical protein